VDCPAVARSSRSELSRCRFGIGWSVEGDGVNGLEIQAVFDEVFDQAVVYHGFTDYMRDYEMVIYTSADPRTGIAPSHTRMLFKHCVQATVTSAVNPAVWVRSLDDRLVETPSEDQPDGYVWGVRWQELYPGLSLLSDSSEADRWSTALGLPFYEAVAGMNGHTVGLVFADLAVTIIEAGYAPFSVALTGPDHKYPLT
jgi:hypothetical protein